MFASRQRLEEQVTSRPTRSAQARLRLLNEPVPISVPETTPSGEPQTVVLRGGTHSVGSVIEQWRLDDGWWRSKPISRHYFRLQLDDGRLVTIFFDRERTSWWTQRV